MFKKKSKRPNSKKVIRTLDEGGSESDTNGSTPAPALASTLPITSPAPALVSKTKSKKKAIKRGVLSGLVSFEDDLDDVNNDDCDKKKKKRKKKKGIGFGGSVTVGDGEDAAVKEGDIPSSGDAVFADISAPSSVYGTEALDELRKRQNFTKSKTLKGGVGEIDLSGKKSSGGNESAEKNYDKQSDDKLPGLELESDSMDFLSLSGPLHDSRACDPTTKNSATNLNDKIEFERRLGEDDDAMEWEEEVVSRVVDYSGGKMNNSNRNDNYDSSQLQTLTIPNVLDKLKSARSSLGELAEETDRALRRRENELEEARVDLAKHDGTLSENVPQFEFFQSFREEVADFVGALRVVDKKVAMVEQSILALESQGVEDGRKRRMLIEDDIERDCGGSEATGSVGCISISGRSENVESVNEILVDEFGRDLSHARQNERDKRRELRHTHRGKPTMVTNDNDDRRQKRHNLSLAVVAAVSDIATDFTSLSSLAEIFRKWEEKFPESYKECYGDLLFTGLASVWAREEFARDFDKFSEIAMFETIGEMNWHDVVSKFFDGERKEKICEGIIAGGLEKNLKNLAREGYELGCRVETRRMKKFAGESLSLGNEILSNLRKSLDTWKVILVGEGAAVNEGLTIDIKDSLNYGQRLVENVKEWWGNIKDEAVRNEMTETLRVIEGHLRGHETVNEE